MELAVKGIHMSEDQSASAWRSMARSLAHRNFRLFFVGQGISSIGTWMTRVPVPDAAAPVPISAPPVPATEPPATVAAAGSGAATGTDRPRRRAGDSFGAVCRAAGPRDRAGAARDLGRTDTGAATGTDRSSPGQDRTQVSIMTGRYDGYQLIRNLVVTS